MKYNPYSASSISTFLQCPRKFKYSKIDKIPVEFRETLALTKGKIIHSLLEHHNKSLKEKIEILKNDKDINKSEFFTAEKPSKATNSAITSDFCFTVPK